MLDGHTFTLLQVRPQRCRCKSRKVMPSRCPSAQWVPGYWTNASKCAFCMMIPRVQLSWMPALRNAPPTHVPTSLVHNTCAPLHVTTAHHNECLPPALVVLEAHVVEVLNDLLRRRVVADAAIAVKQHHVACGPHREWDGANLGMGHGLDM